MKKILIIIVFCAVLLLLSDTAKTSLGHVTITDEDYVPDPEAAKRVAEAIWFAFYAENIYEFKPYTAKLVNDSMWVVHTNDKSTFIKIRKSDCKIIDFWRE